MTEPVIGLTIYEIDREGADLSTNNEVRRSKGASSVGKPFSCPHGALGRLWHDIWSPSSLFFFPPSTRRLRRLGDGIAGTQQTVHRPLGRFHLYILALVVHRLAYPKAHFSPFRFSNSSYSRFRRLKGTHFCGKMPSTVRVGADSREFRGSMR
jgi:hypothetical protein